MNNSTMPRIRKQAMLATGEAELVMISVWFALSYVRRANNSFNNLSQQKKCG
jgi:hypothetical protein